MGIMADAEAVSTSKVSNFYGIMDVLEDNGTEIIMAKQYLDLLASGCSKRFATNLCNVVILAVVLFQVAEKLVFAVFHYLFLLYCTVSCVINGHCMKHFIGKCLIYVDKWYWLCSFRDDKTKIQNFVEKICMDQYTDQWVTKFHMTLQTLDKLVDEIRPFVKMMQGIPTIDIW